MNKAKVIEAVRNTVLEGRHTPKEIASSIRKPYSTLLREINPYDAGAKLGLEIYMSILKATGDTTSLRVMAQELGFRLIQDD